ncbi:MAG: ParA family protein [Gammaproteobacteria bacterium]|nr:ParA family protein [Gammaproteobacteria bacterium]
MRVWTIANQKGGVGKTTTTVTLGGLLASWGLRTLLVDIDPHGSMTSYFRYDPDSLEHSTYSLFRAKMDKEQLDPHELIRDTGTDGLQLLPASMALATLDRQSGRLEGMGLVLKQALNTLSDRFDYVLIDCPPMLGVLMVNALAACERLIMPVQTEFLALKGLERMLHTLKMILRSQEVALPYTIVPTFFDRRTKASFDSLNFLQEQYPEMLWDGVIPVDTKFRESSKAGIPPTLYSPNSHGVLAYAKLLEFLHNSEHTPSGQEMVG